MALQLTASHCGSCALVNRRPALRLSVRPQASLTVPSFSGLRTSTRLHSLSTAGSPASPTHLSARKIYCAGDSCLCINSCLCLCICWVPEHEQFERQDYGRCPCLRPPEDIQKKTKNQNLNILQGLSFRKRLRKGTWLISSMPSIALTPRSINSQGLLSSVSYVFCLITLDTQILPHCSSSLLPGSLSTSTQQWCVYSRAARKHLFVFDIMS